MLPLIVLAVVVLAGQPSWAQIDPPPGGGGTPCTPGGIDPCPSDGDPCTEEFCNPATNTCASRPEDPVPDGCGGNEGCDPNAENPCGGEGEGGTCTVSVCNPETRQCETAPRVCPSDDNPCTSEVCGPEVGCHSVPTDPVPDGCGGNEGCDPNAENPCGGEGEGGNCTVSVCNPETRQCESHPKSCAADDNFCTIESCNPETGDCESGEPKSCEGEGGGEGGGEGDPCSTSTCDPSTGECRSEPTNPPPDGCEGAICRTPGFWGTHAAANTKKKAVNITQAVIAAAGGSLSVCGKTINSTIVNDDNSALEAICVSPAGDIRLQLARQLTAAALNCVISGGGADCTGTPLYSSIFTDCNAVCTNSGSSSSSITSCIAQIDCLNNGGHQLASGFCQTGTCSNDGSSPCRGDDNCIEGAHCVPLDSCHTASLVNTDLGLDFDPPGGAGSSSLCNSANKSVCSVIGSSLTSCTK